MEKKGTEVILAGMTAIVGTLDEKAKAFAQIASAASSGLFPAGYDTVPKILAASWFADGLGVHPTIYMEGIQPVQFGGKTVREPKWEFINALLRSRLPGFDYEVNEESDIACEITFEASGRKSQPVRYTMADAVKQGLAGPNGRNRDGYEKNARKMLWKQCFKMGADRIGADVLAGLPAMSFDAEDTLTEGREKSTATVIDEAIAKATGAPAAGGDGQPAAPARDGEQAPSQPSEDAGETPRGKLFALLTRQYGKLSKQAALEKSSFLYNAMMKEETGVDPGETFTKPGHIGPVEAERIAKYLQGKMEARQTAAGAPRESGTEGAPAVAHTVRTSVSAGTMTAEVVTWKPDGTMAREDDAPPDAETAPEPEAAGPSLSDAYAELMATVGRARKLFEPRRFVKEAPEGSGKLWYVDAATFQQAGDVTSVRLAVGPDVVAPVEKLVQLNAILAAACDEKERGGR